MRDDGVVCQELEVPLDMKSDPLLEPVSNHDLVDHVAAAAFGHKFRDARMRLGHSLKDIAQETGLSISLISKIERGQSSPSLRSLILLSQALDMPLGKLFDSSGSPDLKAQSNASDVVVRRAERQ